MTTTIKHYDVYDINEKFEAVFSLHNTDSFEKENHDSYMMIYDVRDKETKKVYQVAYIEKRFEKDSGKCVLSESAYKNMLLRTEDLELARQFNLAIQDVLTTMNETLSCDFEGFKMEMLSEEEFEKIIND
tara:strand:+ start:3834 stop:4223 length:390 start_codon:yes stop_codon:yes gene_type:complete